MLATRLRIRLFSFKICVFFSKGRLKQHLFGQRDTCWDFEIALVQMPIFTAFIRSRNRNLINGLAIPLAPAYLFLFITFLLFFEILHYLFLYDNLLTDKRLSRIHFNADCS